jgi:hypothetical protein
MGTVLFIGGKAIYINFTQVRKHLCHKYLSVSFKRCADYHICSNKYLVFITAPAKMFEIALILKYQFVIFLINLSSIYAGYLCIYPDTFIQET